MVETLPLSRAARAAGVSRTELQAKITAGELKSFEGMVRLDDLIRVFPSARIRESAEIKRVRQIKESALTKPMPDDSPSEFGRLRVQVDDLAQELAAVRARSEAYRRIIDTMTEKLIDAQESCDQRQRILLESVISWVLAQVKQAR